MTDELTRLTGLSKMARGNLPWREGRVAFWSFSQPPVDRLGPTRAHGDILAALRAEFVVKVPDDPARVLHTAARCDVVVLNETVVGEQEAANITAVSDRCYGGAVVVTPPDVRSLRTLAPIKLHDVVLHSEVAPR